MHSKTSNVEVRRRPSPRADGVRGEVGVARGEGDRAASAAARLRWRSLFVLGCLLLCFAAVATQLVRLALTGGARIRAAATEPKLYGWARPDIVDRHGRLLATDLAVPSLHADPQLIQDLDEAVEKLGPELPSIAAAELRRLLADRSRRFVWVARGLSPRHAQRIHELGLPGLGFRTELKRAYPMGALAGHVLGAVNLDNRGLAGIERMIDESGLSAPAKDGSRAAKSVVRLALDIGAQHAAAEELKRAMKQYAAVAAAALVLDVGTGEIRVAVSLPEVDPNAPVELLDPDRFDRLTAGTFELGSLYKILTLALALELGIADLDTILDVREPLNAGGHVIKDPYPQGRPLSAREVYLYSSNVGAGMLALEAGAERQREFLARLGLLQAMRTEAGPVAAPQLPKTWGRTETITIAYGHGLAAAPLQFATTVAAIVNGGTRLTPTFLKPAEAPLAGEPVIGAATSASMRELMRLGVTHAAGTGRRAEAEGYGVGGKTGTAEMPGRGGYRAKAVISSFLGAFPMEQPRYITLVLLFEPQGTPETGGRITASVNAAPLTARIVDRIAPILGVLPRLVEARIAPAFDAPEQAQ
jgi:cell division protein FtsI (penicillin-binding protein 3)